MVHSLHLYFTSIWGFFYIKAIRASLKHEINEHQGFLAVYVVNKTIATLVNNRWKWSIVFFFVLTRVIVDTKRNQIELKN